MKDFAYIAGSLRHTPKEWWPIYEKLGAIVEKFGYIAFIPHKHNKANAGPDDLHNPNLALETRSEVYKINYDAVLNSKLIIAEITNPSTGTGVELGFGLLLQKNIICMAQKQADITSMVLGPAYLGQIKMIRYEKEADALKQLEDVLTSLKSRTPI